MSHTLCITKVFNNAFTLYKNNWKSFLVIGALVGTFWLVEKKLSTRISSLSTFCKYELPQSKHAVEFFTSARKAVQYHLTLPFSYKEYAIFCILMLILLYGQLCISRYFLLLNSQKNTPQLFDAIVSIGTFARAIAAYLFTILALTVFVTLGAILMKVGDWFLLKMEHKVLLVAIYTLYIVVPFMLSFTLLRWTAVDGSPSVSTIIDKCFAITHNNKLKISAIMFLTHLVSYVIQFCFLRLCYTPFNYMNIFDYGVFAAIALVSPLKEAIWSSVYQQIK